MKQTKLSYRLRRSIQSLALKITSPQIMSKFYYRLFLKKRLDLKHPLGFNEKIQWLKLYDFPNNDLVIKCTDKYLVREYIKNKGFESILNDMLFVWDDPNKIDWNLLPNQFAIKCTHGCGYNIICHDKTEISEKKTKRILKRWMKEKFGNYNAEMHYNKIKPRIICEKYLGKELIDYKFYCFDGVPKFLYISTGLSDWKSAKVSFYNLDKTLANFGRTDFKAFDDAPFPKHYDEMLKIVNILAKDFIFVRVDLYEFEDKIYFGELTFTPAGGLMKIEPVEYEDRFGKLLDITKSNFYKDKGIKK